MNLRRSSSFTADAWEPGEIMLSVFPTSFAVP